MLTEEQYKILVLFRSCDIRLDKLPQEIAEQFTQKKYIIRYRPTEPDGSYGETVMCTIAEPGRQALEKFESYMNKIRIRIRKVICQNVKERNSISNKFNREGYEKGGIKIPGGEEKLTVKVNIANVDGILI